MAAAPVRPHMAAQAAPIATTAPSGTSSLRAGPLTLSRATGQWLAGDWRSLADLPDDTVAQHSERDRLSLLVACAHLQRDHRSRAEFHLRRALQWGCDAQLAARLLVSGVHNSMGRIAALSNDAAGVEQHFSQALALTGDAEAAAAAHTRALREMASLSLIPQAVGLLSVRADALEQNALRPVALSAELTMLRSEVDLLQQELALALQRRPQTLAPASRTEDATDPTRAPQTLPSPDKLRAASNAQLGQDLWVLERTGYKRGGFFVEFGATDGVLLSNSHLLETQMQWKGICAEPNPKYFARLQRNRRCTVSDACIGPRSGEVVEFVLADEFGSMAADMQRDMHGERRQAYWADQGNRTQFTTESLHDLLVRLGAPREIDYLSIDTEGSEYAILSTFPFDRWAVRLITVEHNYSADRERIRALLEGQGYKRTEAQWDDWYEKQ